MHHIHPWVLSTYIYSVWDTACTPPKQYPSELRHLRKLVWDSLICCGMLTGTFNTLSSTSMQSQIHHNHFQVVSVPVSRNTSYSDNCLNCPLWVWLFHEIDASQFKLHLYPYTPEDSQWLTSIWVIQSWKLSPALKGGWRSYSSKRKIRTWAWVTMEAVYGSIIRRNIAQQNVSAIY